MRIIAGDLRGRRLHAPSNLPVRPTTDLARESLFNILRNKVDFEEISTLDLFAGTGSISFEFLSRGVKEAMAVDQDQRCVDFIKKTAIEFGIDNLFAIRSDAFIFLGRSQMTFDVVFADPPYDLKKFEIIPELVLKSFVKPNGWFIIEHSKEISFKDKPFFVEQRNYGKVNFSFFQLITQEF